MRDIESLMNCVYSEFNASFNVLRAQSCEIFSVAGNKKKRENFHMYTRKKV